MCALRPNSVAAGGAAGASRADEPEAGSDCSRRKWSVRVRGTCELWISGEAWKDRKSAWNAGREARCRRVVARIAEGFWFRAKLGGRQRLEAGGAREHQAGAASSRTSRTRRSEERRTTLSIQ